MLRLPGVLPIVLSALLLGAPARAQSTSPANSSSEEHTASSDVAPGNCEMENHLAFEEATAARPAAPPSEAEAHVQDIIADEGIHVVRLWAPWCNNSTAEMRRGWDRLLAENEDVTFTFVTVWNNGRRGRSTLERYGLDTDRITEVVPEKPAQGRLNTFLGFAVNWIPATWVFRTPEADDPPERAFALDYGETDRATLQTLLDTAKRDW